MRAIGRKHGVSKGAKVRPLVCDRGQDIQQIPS
jgi:hypothetical protein